MIFSSTKVNQRDFFEMTWSSSAVSSCSSCMSIIQMASFLKQDAGKGQQRKFISRHSSDALDKVAAHVHDVGAGGKECITAQLTPAQAAMLRASSSVCTEGGDTGSGDKYKSLDRFGSLDSSDTFLSCATHPFPSQGSLAGLEELAAVGSMAPNGSMPAVNIPSFNNNGVYVNPFDPPSASSASAASANTTQVSMSRSVNNNVKRHCRITGQMTPSKGTLTPSPQGSPHSRRVRIGGRSVSSDVELADFESDFSAANREAYHEELSAPKHRRARVSQQQVNLKKVSCVPAGRAAFYSLLNHS